MQSDPEIILFATLGRSPAVVTETVWALAQESPPVIPHRVEIISTSVGKTIVETELFGTQTDSIFGQLSVWEAIQKTLSDQGNDISGKLRCSPRFRSYNLGSPN